MMTIKIFGALKDVFQQDVISINAMADVQDLRNQLNYLYPSLHNKTFAIAINKTITHDNVPLSQDAEIALLPPFSGG